MELQRSEGELALIDLDFRPPGYFWPLDLATHLLATVKGAERRKSIQLLIDTGRLDLLQDQFAHSSLDPEVRRYTGRIHPSFMGGEYLPNLLPGEVEVARVTLASTTQDVVSIRARRGKNRIRYRVVDEYEGETLSEFTQRTSVRPLTLGQLVAFLDRAWSVREVVTMNELGCNVDEMRDFVSVSSPFYPHLAMHYDKCFVEWADECEKPVDEDGDDAVAAGGGGGRE